MLLGVTDISNDIMEVDNINESDAFGGWEGSGLDDHGALFNALDECLTIGT